MVQYPNVVSLLILWLNCGQTIRIPGVYEDTGAGPSTIMENGNTSLGSDDGSIEGENERGFFISVSILTTKKNWTG
jgi:hypothetical protein